MKETSLNCRDELRRVAVRKAHGICGLDYLEVSGDQLQLHVIFLGKAPTRLHRANVVIRGGERVIGIRVKDVQLHRVGDPELDDSMDITVDRHGDFSTYTLCVVEVDEHDLPITRRTADGSQEYRPHREFDPRYACLPFSFKAGCPSDLDCALPRACPPPLREQPEINYLAKDYASFRQLIFDRLALIMHDWQERHVPDVGVALVELLAYAGDYLSYFQDAVATEAYLATARQRTSVRRHARLVDYLMHEGCNARAWVSIATDTNWLLDPDPWATRFLSRMTGQEEKSRVLGKAEAETLSPDSYEIFEVYRGADATESPKKIPLYVDHSEIHFYTWGDRECCLARGATSATLIGEWSPPPDIPEARPGTKELDQKPDNAPEGTSDKKPEVKPYVAQPSQTPPVPQQPVPECKLHLQVGDVLIFEEVLGPRTGIAADANPSHRHAVRLTRVTPARDNLFGQPIVEIEWASEDALPFALCISAVSQAPDCNDLENVSVARGNVVLVDHGKTITEDPQPNTVPTDSTMAQCPGECYPPETSTIPGKFSPVLPRKPLTFSQPLRQNSPASTALRQDPRLALPWIKLSGPQRSPREEAWAAQRDLLSSRERDLHFVIEMDDEGAAHLRFGDGELGHKPEAGTVCHAAYRVGNGPSGNVGAEAIGCIVTDVAGGVQLLPRNPLPAQGGLPPELMAEVKHLAPYTFRQELQRAITADDYAAIAARNPKLQRAAATLRWTGSWYEASVAVDPRGTEEASPGLRREIEKYLYRFRRMGHDLAVRSARYVPLQIGLSVCVLPHYLRAHVKAALLDVFSNRVLPDGTLGFFHPDNLTFGEGVDLSGLVAAAQAVTGVESVEVTKLQRLFEAPNHEIENGILTLGSLEVAQLDNDASFPERGMLTLDVRGGR